MGLYLSWVGGPVRLQVDRLAWAILRRSIRPARAIAVTKMMPLTIRAASRRGTMATTASTAPFDRSAPSTIRSDHSWQRVPAPPLCQPSATTATRLKAP